MMRAVSHCDECKNGQKYVSGVGDLCPCHAGRKVRGKPHWKARAHRLRLEHEGDDSRRTAYCDVCSRRLVRLEAGGPWRHVSNFVGAAGHEAVPAPEGGRTR